MGVEPSELLDCPESPDPLVSAVCSPVSVGLLLLVVEANIAQGLVIC